MRAMTTTDPAGRADRRPGGRRRRTGWPVWVHLLAALLVMGLLQGFVARVYRVPSGSMEPTLAVGQRFLVERVSYRFADVQRQDVIVFRIDPQWRGAPDPAVDGPGELARWTLGLLGVGSGLEDPLVKRVIGLPGDTVACCDEAGRVLVNDVPLAEPYLGPDLAFAAGHHDCRSVQTSPRCFGPIIVPPGRLLVLGDHRASSADSVQHCRGRVGVTECARFVRTDRVVGRAVGLAHD